MRTLFLLLIFIISANMSGQNYSFPTKSASWHNIYRTHQQGSGQVLGQELTHLYIVGDSVINNVTYHQLEGFSKDSNQIRETKFYRVDGEKVFLLQPNDTTEYLAYDFDLQIGDTFWVESRRFFIVQNIDSLLLHDGNHKVIIFNEDVKFIRGIGSPQGVFGFLGPNVSNFSTELICFSHQKVTLYPRFSDSSCFSNYQYLKKNEVRIKPTRIYPNPTKYALNIPNLNEYESFVVYNVIGEKQHVKKSKNALMVSELPAGIYTLNLVKNGLLIRHKFIVQ